MGSERIQLLSYMIITLTLLSCVKSNLQRQKLWSCIWKCAYADARCVQNNCDGAERHQKCLRLCSTLDKEWTIALMNCLQKDIDCGTKCEGLKLNGICFEACSISFRHAKKGLTIHFLWNIWIFYNIFYRHTYGYTSLNRSYCNYTYCIQNRNSEIQKFRNSIKT